MRSLLPKFLLTLSLITSLAHAAGAPTPSQGRAPGNIRQNVTAGRMRMLRLCLDVYWDENGKYPSRLSFAVNALYPHPKEDFLHDAWGREFLYYRTGSAYFVGSLGRDGKSDGDLANEESEDCDITMISGQFARLPFDVAE